MPVPQNVTDAVKRAGEIVRRPWPPLWRFPIPSQADAVWDALGPLNDHIQQGGHPTVQRKPADTPDSILAKAEAAILDLEICAGNVGGKRGGP